MFFALVIQSSSLKFGRQHRCSLRLPFNVPLPSLGLSDEPKEHLHEDANTYQWPTLLGNFVLNCSLTKSIIKQICFFFFKKRKEQEQFIIQALLSPSLTPIIVTQAKQSQEWSRHVLFYTLP